MFTLVRKPNAVFKKLEAPPSFNLDPPVFKEVDELVYGNQDIFTFFSEQVSVFWHLEEIEYNIHDIQIAFPKLDEDYQTIIKSILLFFTVADKIVLGNLTSISDTPYKSASYYFAAQNYIESVHDLSYEKAARLYYNDDEKYKNDLQLLNSIISTAEAHSDEEFDLNNYSCSYYESKSPIEKLIFDAVALKVNLMNKWKNIKSYRHNLIAFAIIENISFNALFALINTFKEANKGLKFIIEINEFVSRDENIHARFGLFFYRNFILNHVPEEEFLYILKEITEVELEFLKRIIPKDKKIHNRTLDDYLSFVKEYANGITTEMNYKPLYVLEKATRPEFNVPQMKIKNNFFERVGTYESKPQILTRNAFNSLFDPPQLTYREMDEIQLSLAGERFYDNVPQNDPNYY